MTATLWRELEEPTLNGHPLRWKPNVLRVGFHSRIAVKSDGIMDTS